jgi:transposase-like protein
MDKHLIMKEQIKRYQNSGMSIREYCNEFDLTEDSFHYWKSKFTRESKQKSNQSLIPVEIESKEEVTTVRKSVLIKIGSDGLITIKIGN